jgi:hypothetical protein
MQPDNVFMFQSREDEGLAVHTLHVVYVRDPLLLYYLDRHLRW